MRYTKAPVAQLDRASDFGSEGWGFESLQARGKWYPGGSLNEGLEKGDFQHL